MASDKQHPIPPDQIETLFDLIRSRDSLAFDLLRTLYRKRIFRYFSRWRIPPSDREVLFRETLLNIWISAPNLACAARLPSHIAWVVKSTTRNWIGKRLNEDDLLTFLDRLELAIRRIDGPAEDVARAVRILEELRRPS